ncbi:indolepyruvate oxidoreductase [Steroidobacter agaridevorans]|uniref:Indolepyruvate oxidoreductase n=1 Tax=Steroidobacter agaridevorans TaxID=2695856 RepID=A0A829YI77_9GAMM|nr:indolepyruvate oxidoreductase subunit beta family protein [Steroidobacter agaridevorans]GFE83007.1 indolepyruvate oxidoreductase [Steroidobacter agaridevorans]
MHSERPISIAIAALGGQGGGVLAEWLVAVAELHGWMAQSTSVPGVAQRTGTTVYYVEMSPKPAPGRRSPVFALMPVPGDVDLVVAAELMEAGRTVVRGLVTPERTTVVASSHRVYGITEKSAMGDGIADANAVLSALNARARRLICFEMEAAADRHKSVISSVLFGAIAAAAVLPFSRGTYEQAISDYGVAVKANLAGFQAGFDQAMQSSPVAGWAPPSSAPTTELGRALDERIKREFPAHLHGILQEGVKRMLDYQDDAYADLYLERMTQIRSCDESVARLSRDFSLTNAVARYLALWMSYEDTIRVADLKTRSRRFERFRAEVRAGADQVVYVTEFMHPRFEEVCETLPAGLGSWFSNSAFARRLSAPLFRRGRHIHTAKLGGFVMLSLLAGMRRWRRSTLRYRVEQARIADWLERIRNLAAAPGGYRAAIEIAECQRLVKGYSDTHARGLKNYQTVVEAAERMRGRSDLADAIRQLRNAALADEAGLKLASVLSEVAPDG